MTTVKSYLLYSTNPTLDNGVLGLLKRTYSVRLNPSVVEKLTLQLGEIKTKLF